MNSISEGAKADSVGRRVRGISICPIHRCIDRHKCTIECLDLKEMSEKVHFIPTVYHKIHDNKMPWLKAELSIKF